MSRSNKNEQSSSGVGWLTLGVVGLAGIAALIGHSYRKNEQPQSYETRRNIVPFPPPDECAICKDVMKSPMEQLPCNHLFHKDCILLWFERSFECPICRYILSKGQVDKYLSRVNN